MKTVRTTYTCDRCGGNADYKACHGGPPHAESYLLIGLWGAGSPNLEKVRDLCGPCYDSLHAWLKRRDAEQQ